MNTDEFLPDGRVGARARAEGLMSRWATFFVLRVIGITMVLIALDLSWWREVLLALGLQWIAVAFREEVPRCSDRDREAVS